MKSFQESEAMAGEEAAPENLLQQKLSRFSLNDLAERQRRLDLAVEEAQIKPPGAFPLDILPRLISSDEWEVISRGVIQRMKAFNLFISDVYSRQTILKNRAIPHNIVLEDPSFLREAVGMPILQEYPVTYAAFDLLKDEEGRWQVLENHMALPHGVSHVMMNRRLLRQVFPEIFEETDVMPVAAFSTIMLETLRSLSKEQDPFVVLLRDPQDDDALTLPGFLSRRMGIPTVSPSDLLVRESHLYLKTVAGLQKVDVIYRRIRSTWIDPVAFGSTQFGGIAGLMSCIRRGSVVVANALGTGVGDNKGLLRYSDTIIRYYLHADPILSTVPTYNCHDVDQLEHSLRMKDKVNFHPIQTLPSIQSYFDYTLSLRAPETAEELLESHSQFVVAQKKGLETKTPSFHQGEVVERPFRLRVFVLMGEHPFVLPGGLALQAFDSTGQNFSSPKDTWVIAKPGTRVPRNLTNPRPPRQLHKSISSKTGEALYWMGRYAERAENTGRMLHVLGGANWEEMQPSSQSMHWPLWRAVAAATGQKQFAALEKPPVTPHLLAEALTIDPSSPASILSCLHSIHRNTEVIREYIVLEVWEVISQCHSRVNKMAVKRPTNRSQIQEICHMVVESTALLHGTFDRTMPRDEGWDFFKIGSLIERGFCTMSILHHVLSHAIETVADPSEENPDLTALLRLLGSLDAYRRDFQSRAYIDRVAQLLWQSRETPSSVSFCCEGLIQHVRSLIQNGGASAAQVLSEKMENTQKLLADIKCSTLFPRILMDTDAPSEIKQDEGRLLQKRLLRTHSSLMEEWDALHAGIEDVFFHHQSRDALSLAQPQLLFSTKS